MNKDEIRQLLQQGKENGDLYLIIIQDGFDYDEYEVYARTLKEATEKVREYGEKEMQTVTSVYRIDQDWDEQLSTESCWRV